jgi:general secretion pathway protein C
MNLSEFFRQPRARQSLIGAVNAGALLALTASLAHWSWLILPSPQLPASPALASNIPAVERPFNIQPLLVTHLFGQTPVIPTETNSTAIQASSLNLVLTGIIGVKDAGLAIISVNNQPQEPFVVGQTITGNAVLQAVYPDRVTILRNGALETLPLDLTAASAPPPPSIPPLPRPMGQMTVPDTSPIRNFVNRDALLDKIRTTDLIKKTAFAPVAGGLLVLHGQKGNILESFGVQASDVIRSVNGQNLTTFDDMMRVYQSLISSQGSTPIQIEIIRHGKPQTLQYRME